MGIVKILTAMHLIITFSIISIVTGWAWSGQSLSFANDQVVSADHQKLSNEKLKLENEKLRIESDNLKSFWGRLPDYSTMITALLAIIGMIITILKLINESRLNREQRENDNLRRVDERFNSIITNLGSESESNRASAAVSILTFLRPEHQIFHYQVFMILLANLKIRNSEAIYDLLIEGFEKALQVQLPLLKQSDKNFELNLSRAPHLKRINLSGLDLSNSDLGFTMLKYANLSGSKTSLYRARGIGAILEKAWLSEANLNEAKFKKANFKYAKFHKSNLVAAVLKEADLSYAEFNQASMQSAHLEGATLIGTKFEQANINDAFFNDLKEIDEATLRSLLKTRDKTWQKAHFDKEIMRKLIEMNKSLTSEKK
ncbi:MAG: low-complexity protein [Nitrospirae bacterium]|nr:MAG: low-complexity protein [Nitrospirota bacterium]